MLPSFNAAYTHTMRILTIASSFLLVIATQAQAPQLWGMTQAGGANALGTIFRMNLDGTGYEVVHSFVEQEGTGPEGGLCQAPDGYVYGLTNSDGENGVGTVFRISPSTLEFDVVFHLSGAVGASPWSSLLLADNGKLYGGGSGSAFEVDPITGVVTAIGQYSMNEVFIQASDGWLYGSDAYGGGAGAIFRINPSTLAHEVVHSFSDIDGSTPYGRLCQAGNGKLYGFTYDGGTNDEGVLYEYDPSTDAFTKLLDLIGTNGGSPWSGFVTLGADLLLAPVTLGGANGLGALMELQPSTGEASLVHSFSTTVDGGLLFGGIVQAGDGAVYGMTTMGGDAFAGTIYRFDPVSAQLTTLHEFDGATGGSNPRGELFVVDDVVGIASMNNKADLLRVWPNPAQGDATLEVNDARLIGAPLRMCDMTGRTVWEGRVEGVLRNIALPAQPGHYVLSCMGSQAVLQQSVIVR